MGFVVGDRVWVKGAAEWVWEIGSVESVVSETEVVVKTESSRRILTDYAFRSNVPLPAGFEDMTSMTYVNEPAILSNLHRRSYANKPYTFLGSVMVAVNPLKEVVDPDIEVGTPGVALRPHPYAVAETAYSQLKFGCMQKRRGVRDDMASPVSQTVVVGGESGAGKTESSKRVLQHLVARCGGGELDRRLLGTNPILEAFGNAQTLRNPNSSRFGKMLRLHFDGDARSITGASIETYLLERSRVTSHENGERSFHIFYQVIAGLSKDKSLGVNAKQMFAYLTPGGEAKANHKPQMRAEDAGFFAEVVKAFTDVGVSKAVQDSIFKIVAGILHLGNIQLRDVDMPEGQVAQPRKNDLTTNALELACATLGFASQDELLKMFCERKIKAPGSGEIIAFNDAKTATEARDAVARTLYSRLFNYILTVINDAIDPDSATNPDDPMIGVLDIFGFESFQHNGFEQLLINYTNESLQSTFNEQIFHSELELYKRENLVLESHDKMTAPKTNEVCMELLEGKNGILTLLDQHGQLPQPNDKKFNDAVHKEFRKSSAFGKVHPKDIDRCFIVVHYAGSVTYTVGSFLAKNANTMPATVDETMARSSHPLIADVWSCLEGGSRDSASKSKKKKTRATIVSGFKEQIVSLKDYLDSTRCSFIRCIKPNALMQRKGDGWFDRRYVTSQLKALSVLSTAEVLKNGFPTRVTYDELVESYQPILPDRALEAWKGLGGGSETAFVAALFWAFGVPRESYKLGLSRVFFKSGQLAELESILGAASSWESGESSAGGYSQEEVSARFKKYFARRRWRVAFAKASAVASFSKIMTRTKGRSVAAALMQRWYRGAAARGRFHGFRRAALIVQKYARAKKDRKEYRKRLRDHNQELQRREREAREALEAAQKEQEEIERKREAARQAREAKEREQADLRKRQEEAEANKKKLVDMEKSFASIKSNTARLMAKRKKQLAALEDAGDFLAGDGDGDADDSDNAKQKELEQVREQREEEERRLAEIAEENEALERELEEAKEEELAYEAEASDISGRIKAQKKVYDELFQQWKQVKRQLEAKKKRQLDHLHDANVSFNLDHYLERIRRGKPTPSRNMTLWVLRAQTMKARHRPSRGALSATDSQPEDEDDEDLGYNWGAAKTSRQEKRSLTAEGDKLPVKQGNFRIFSRWAPRRFVLNPSLNEVRYFPIGDKANTKAAGVFRLNPLESTNPSKVVKDPKNYSRRNKHILAIVNGYLKEDAPTRDPKKRSRTLVIAFKSKRDRDDWYDMLAAFTEDGRPRSSDKLNVPDVVPLGTHGDGEEDGGVKRFSQADATEMQDLLESGGISQEEYLAWSRRTKVVEKNSAYSEEEKERILLNPVLRSQEEAVNEVLTPYVAFCSKCNSAQAVVDGDDEVCPSCGGALRA